MMMDAFLKRFDRAQRWRNADALAAAVAISLPWSTSATGILVFIWLVAIVAALDFSAVRREAATPAGGLPVLLVALGILGMFWADVPWTDRLDGAESFLKLLMIPLLFAQFRRSERALWVAGGFLVSCTVLLVMSFTLFAWPGITGAGPNDIGIPVHNYIAQSGEFMTCAFVLAYVALDLFKAGRHLAMVAVLALSATFLLNIFFVVTSRTALVIIPILLVLFGLRHFSWRGLAGLLAAGIIVGALVLTLSPYLRERVGTIPQEAQSYATDNAITSGGERLTFWRKSLDFVGAAPMIGHGTGSIAKMFQQAAVGETGLSAEAPTNPHNQIFGVAIQIGLIGVAVLLAMWLSHFLLFWQPGLFAWIGLIVVVQNVVGSLFNSHLFDFGQGWFYVFGVGVAGGAVLRSKDRTQPRPAPLP